MTTEEARTPVRHVSRISEMLIERVLNDTPSWMFDGLCHQQDEVDFLHDKEYDAAKEICQQCPVREQCLEEGVAKDNEEGVWGGEDIWDYLHPEEVAEREARESEQREAVENPAGVEGFEDA